MASRTSFLPPTRTIVSRVFLLLLPISICSLLYLYLYPLALGCRFPTPPSPPEHLADIPTWKFFEVWMSKSGKQTPIDEQASAAPFRLLVLADPQIEGDTALDGVELNARIRGWPRPLQLATRYLKALDLWGNDYYLAHQYRTLKFFGKPTHTVVLGDLIGSQWVEDDEWDRRTSRFWNRVVPGGKVVPRNVSTSTFKTEKEEEEAWRDRVIAVAGNHDVGYAGDIYAHRMERFEETFGPANYAFTYTVPRKWHSARASPREPKLPSLRIIVLNSMLLDGPAKEPSLQGEVHGFLASQSNGGRDTTTVLLTHLPLHKPAGVCVDGPFFNYFPEFSSLGHPGGIKEQNHLSVDNSRWILEGLFGRARKLPLPPLPEPLIPDVALLDHKARKLNAERASLNAAFEKQILQSPNGIVLNGHDHAGCDVLHIHHPNSTHLWYAQSVSKSGKFDQTVFRNPPEVANAVREITTRSMMGAYGGNAVLLSAWPDYSGSGQVTWRFEANRCPLGVQHVWWATHIIALITMLTFVLKMALGSDDEGEKKRIEEEAKKERENGRVKVRIPEIMVTSEFEKLDGEGGKRNRIGFLENGKSVVVPMGAKNGGGSGKKK